jgi:hypothetical protein
VNSAAFGDQWPCRIRYAIADGTQPSFADLVCQGYFVATYPPPKFPVGDVSVFMA